jgi:transposase InsO family protein
MVRRVRDEGWTAAQAAAAAGVSLRTVRKWLARHRAEGEAGLLDRSSRPRSSSSPIGAGWREVIVRLRRCRMTAEEIARHLGLARSTVAAELRRLGLNRLAALEPKAPVRRYERARPGDLIHLDVKKLARFDKPGHRVTGRRRGQNAGVGWEFVHVCIDDHARLAYVEALDDETGEVCARFLARAVVWFSRQGVCVRRVMTDNGTGYRSHRFRQAREALGVRHLRTRPYTPKTNGKAERCIKTLLEDWAYAVPYRSSTSRRRQLPVWVRHYNHERPHGSLAGLPPASRLPARVNNLAGMHN